MHLQPKQCLHWKYMMHLDFFVCVLLGGAVPDEDHMVLSTGPGKTGSFSANRNASFKQSVSTAA